MFGFGISFSKKTLINIFRCELMVNSNILNINLTLEITPTVAILLAKLVEE
jgi:hypothetical protein